MTATDPGDELYALALDEFVASRDALAVQLRKNGDKEAAGRVKKRRKPSLAAWAVNQLARRDRDGIQELLALRQQIEDADDARALRSASEERRALIARLVADAETILQEAGHTAGANTVQAITQTLYAGDDEDTREDLLHGRLTRELKPVGFGGFTPGSESDTGEDVPPDPKLEEKRKRAEELAREADDAEEDARRLEKEADAAERHLKKARAKAESARRSAAETRAHAERAQAEIQGARA